MRGNDRKQVTLGVDIGATTAKMGYVDRDGNCLVHGASVATGAGQSPDLFFQKLYEAAEALRAQIPECELVGVGIGAANANYYKGTIECSPNLGWDYVDVRATLGKYYQVPVAITNDANAAAIGEMLFGAARGMKDFISITLGTGLGSGIVAGGSMVYGADGFAGELGHTIVYPQGRECACGRHGCLETYCSATGLCRTVLELICNTALPSELRLISYRELTSEKVARAALQGDPLALAAFAVCGETLGLALSNAVAYLSPEAIIICGGLAAAGELILEPTRQALEKYVFPVYRGKVKVIASGLIAGNIAILGAGALAWNAREHAGALPC